MNIPVFDDLAPGSFQYGLNYLIEFEPDSLWNETSQTIVAEAVKSKIKTEYHVFQRTYEEAQSSLQKLGVDVQVAISKDLLRIIDSYTVTTARAVKESGQRTVHPFPGGKLLDLKKWDDSILEAMKRNLDEGEKRWLHVDDNTTLLLQYNSEDTFFDGWRTFFIPWGKERELIMLNAFVAGSASSSFYKKIEALYDGIIDFATIREEGGGSENVVRLRTLRGRTIDTSWKQLILSQDGLVGLASKMLIFDNDQEKAVFDYLVDSYVQDLHSEKLAPSGSGWRSFVDIARALGVPSTIFYPIENSHLLRNLKLKGLVEIGRFYGQRGRGGDVTRIRLNVENVSVNEAVKKRANLSRALKR